MKVIGAKDLAGPPTKEEMELVWLVRQASIARLEAAGRYGPTAYFLPDGTPTGGVDAKGEPHPD